MKLLTQDAPELWTQQPGYIGACEHVARCAAICYDSKPKKGGEAADFVDKLLFSEHMRPLEFASIILPISYYQWESVIDHNFPYASGVYGRKQSESVTGIHNNYVIINMRYLMDLGRTAFLGISRSMEGKSIEQLFDTWMDEDATKAATYNRPTIHYPRLARSIADELRTHTTISTIMRSTRYVSANKGGEVAFVLPGGEDERPEPDDVAQTRLSALASAEDCYDRLIKAGASRNTARDILPLCTATEMVQCGLRRDWINLVNVRSNKAAHGDCQWLAHHIRSVIDNIGPVELPDKKPLR